MACKAAVVAASVIIGCTEKGLRSGHLSPSRSLDTSFRGQTFSCQLARSLSAQ